MTGRVVLITGANSGLGFEAARCLCEGGNDVILACRNEDRGKEAVEKILKQNPNALATFMQLDLSDLDSVRKFAEDFHSLGKKLNVLIANAGLHLSRTETNRQFTKDNFELTMGTNHLGHFLLTNLLLDDLKATGSEVGDTRVVIVTSTLHDRNSKGHKKIPADPLDVENFFLEKSGTYSGLQAYKNSKLAMVLFMHELARKMEGTGVTVNAVCPGFIPSTGLGRHATAPQRFMLRYVLNPMFRLMKITRTLEQGSRALVDLAIGEKFKDITGKYYRDGEEAQPSDEAQDEELQKRVWELSARYCHLEGYEPLDAPIPPPPEEVAKTKSKKEKGGNEEGQDEGQGPSGEGQGQIEEVKVEGEAPVAEKTEEAKPEEVLKSEETVEEKKEETPEVPTEPTPGEGETTEKDKPEEKDDLKKEAQEIVPQPVEVPAS